MRRRNYFGQRGDQFWATAPEFLHALTRKFFYHSISARGKFHVDDSVVGMIVQPPQQTHARQAVNPFHGRVVLHKKPGRQVLDGGAISRRHSADGEKKLKLFGLQSGRAGRFFALR
jgi:hypothetical protein